MKKLSKRAPVSPGHVIKDCNFTASGSISDETAAAMTAVAAAIEATAKGLEATARAAEALARTFASARPIGLVIGNVTD